MICLITLSCISSQDSYINRHSNSAVSKTIKSNESNPKTNETPNKSTPANIFSLVGRFDDDAKKKAQEHFGKLFTTCSGLIYANAWGGSPAKEIYEFEKISIVSNELKVTEAHKRNEIEWRRMVVLTPKFVREFDGSGRYWTDWRKPKADELPMVYVERRNGILYSTARGSIGEYSQFFGDTAVECESLPLTATANDSGKKPSKYSSAEIENDLRERGDSKWYFTSLEPRKLELTSINEVRNDYMQIRVSVITCNLNKDTWATDGLGFSGSATLHYLLDDGWSVSEVETRVTRDDTHAEFCRDYWNKNKKPDW